MRKINIKKIFLCVLLIIALIACQNAGISEGSGIDLPHSSSENHFPKDGAEAGSSNEATENESRTSVGKDGGADRGELNPDTPDDAGDAAQDESEDESYAKTAQRGQAMAEYLEKNVSEDDRGAVYFLMVPDVIELSIWAVNVENVQKAIDSYTGEPFEVKILPTDCSYKKLRLFSEEVNSLEASPGEKISAIISEVYNLVAVNMTEGANARLEEDIYSIAEKHEMPEGSWRIVVLSADGENINT